jgi:hypothetical protein
MPRCNIRLTKCSPGQTHPAGLYLFMFQTAANLICALTYSLPNGQDHPFKTFGHKRSIPDIPQERRNEQGHHGICYPPSADTSHSTEWQEEGTRTFLDMPYTPQVSQLVSPCGWTDATTFFFLLPSKGARTAISIDPWPSVSIIACTSHQHATHAHVSRHTSPSLT